MAPCWQEDAAMSENDAMAEDDAAVEWAAKPS